MLTITLGKKTWAVIVAAAGLWYFYHWAYNKGAVDGINYVYNELQRAQEKPAKPDGEPGYLDHSHDHSDQS